MRPLDGYPQPAGYSKVSVFPHAGPLSYQPVVETSPAEAPVTGGDIVEAVEAGLKLFDYVAGGLTDDGAFRVECIPNTASGFFTGNGQGTPSPTYVLRWVDVATGNEVTFEQDLSDRIVRLFAYGPK